MHLLKSEGNVPPLVTNALTFHVGYAGVISRGNDHGVVVADSPYPGSSPTGCPSSPRPAESKRSGLPCRVHCWGSWCFVVDDGVA